MRKALLVADGPSDRVLLPLLHWLAREHGLSMTLTWADLSGYAQKVKTLAKRVEAALALYECDLLFIHRDAEKDPVSLRDQEIAAAFLQKQHPYVPVIPIRMTEAWFLFDEDWSEVKSVFLEIQAFHCCYCQTEIGGRVDKRTGRRSTVSQDVEHFRPKRHSTGRVDD